MHDFYSLLRQLVREPAVVGLEDGFFQIVRRELEDLSISVTQYMGVLVATGANPERGYISAHVDRNGLLCTGPNEFQYAAFIAGNRGELNGDSISEQFMDTIAGRFRGARVQAHSPRSGAYLGQAEILDASICSRRRNLIFKLDGLEYLQPGTPISFVDRLEVTEATIAAQLDNVVSVAMAIDLFRRGYQGTAFFTAGEEGGRSWRYLAEWFQRSDRSTDRLLVLDTSPFPDLDEVGKQDVVLRWKDANGAFNRSLTQSIADRCKQLGIRFCFKDAYIEQLNRSREKPLSLGRTELGRVISALGNSVQGTTIQLPTTAYHTQSETANRTAVDSMIRLLEDLLID
ncbi:peptidase M42 [Roseiconus lacunae]|uniref:peptidase M42 n=1 Tax=Roseiconus lacunae TaxID=2605694 RepID=UPI0011F27503|nr:peptidase M42 [Roseiconus lacunae]MCD0458706.1 peptidase M42 [Roseiconus lacunae]